MILAPLIPAATFGVGELCDHPSSRYRNTDETKVAIALPVIYFTAPLVLAWVLTRVRRARAGAVAVRVGVQRRIRRTASATPVKGAASVFARAQGTGKGVRKTDQGDAELLARLARVDPAHLAPVSAGQGLRPLGRGAGKRTRRRAASRRYTESAPSAHSLEARAKTLAPTSLRRSQDDVNPSPFDYGPLRGPTLRANGG
ncbi:MAG: hypothetical protein ACJ79L_10405 [Anaeromyxobacteraceae bacterium]